MPVLRFENDSGLGETFSGLGRSLSEAFNPYRMMQGYQLQQRMFLEQEQLRELMRQHAAQQAAIAQWSGLVPPDKMPYIANLIYQNAPYDQIMRAATQLSGALKDDPAAMQENIRYIEKLTGRPYDYATLGPPVAGPATQKAYDDWKVTQAGKTAEATRGGQIAAETNPAAAAAIAAAEAQKTGATTTAQNVANAGAIQALTAQYVDDPAHDAQNRAIAAAIEKLGGPKAAPPGFIQPAGPNTSELFRQQQAGQAGATKGAETRNTPQPPGVTIPPPGGFGAAPAATAAPPPAAPPPAAAPPAAAPSPAPATTTSTTLPATTSYGQPTPVTRQTPAGTVIGQTTAESEASKGSTEANQKILDDAISQATSAKLLNAKLDQLHDLSTMLNAGGVSGQLRAAAAQRLANAGFTVGSTAEVYAAINQIINSEIPDLRRAAGIQRLAGPEIQASKQMLGAANMPPAVLDNIIANEKALANAQIERGNLAMRTRYVPPDNPNALSMPDYTTQSADIDSRVAQGIDTLRKQYGAIGAPQAPQVAQPAAPSIWSIVPRLFGSGGSSAAPSAEAAPPAPGAPASAPAPSNVPVFSVDPNGRLVPAQGVQ